MTAPFTDLSALAAHLRVLAGAHQPIVLDDTILAAATAAALAIAFALPDGQNLTVTGVAPGDIGDPAGNMLTISTGTGSMLQLTDVPIALSFWIAGGDLQLSVTATMPDDWTFTVSFPDLTLFPFDSLTVSAALFVYSTVEQPAFSWPGQAGTTIDLQPGQNLLCQLGLGGVSLVASLLGAVIGKGNSFRCFGPFAPTAGQQLPVGTLTASIGSSGFSIGTAPYALSLAAPRVAVRIGTADDDTNPVQDIDLAVLGTFQQVLQVSVSIPMAGDLYQVSTTPLPNESSITSLIESLPGGVGFTDYIPAELSSIFGLVGLDNFTMAVNTTPAVSYLGLSISTLQPWPLISGVLVLEGLNLVVEVVDPSGLDWTSVQIAAQAEFLPHIFTGEFDFTVGLEKQTSWEVSTVSGSYQGSVTLGDLVAGLLGSQDSVPAVLRGMSFAGFGVSATRPAQGQPFAYTCYGSALVALPVLDSGLTAQLTVVFSKTATGYSVQLAGALVIGGEAFALELDLGSATSLLSATWTSTGSPLEFGDIADTFGFTLPPIPSDLDLSLTSAEFQYDISAGTFVLWATSANYGNAVFAVVPSGGTTQYYFLLAAKDGFSLCNLPLVGAELSRVENVTISGITVFVGSQAVAAAAVPAVNQVLGVAPAGYPLLPATGVSGTVMLTAQLDFGSDTLPLSVALVSAATPGAVLALDAAGAAAQGSQVTATTNSAGVTWFTVQRSFGPVSIQRIGASYQSATQSLWFEIDATMAFGPLTLTLNGLGLGSSLASFSPRFDLQGLGVSYSNPPLEIAGLLVNLAPPGATYIAFEGGITISTGDFTVTAFGYYGDQGGFTSLFIFADVAYDFGGPPAFFVTGIALGFGYNSQVQMPTVDQVATFPFIAALPTSTMPSPSLLSQSTPPLTALGKLTVPPPWVSPVLGSIWGAAGLTFTSFELVNSQALLVIDVGSELTIALLGTSRAQFPQLGTVTYANIELELMAEFAPGQGVFFIEALLAASSFLLDKACVLTGGLAFYVWYGKSPHAGDFVFTVGGYNPGFVPPSYYPQVPRVGFHWAMDSTISISGGAYLAVTPAALMVGGELDATYQSGNLKAWFDAHADVIIRWKPFWFDAEIGITIGASYQLHLFGTHNFSVELGCDLEFWGPPTGGKVHVSWYVISFTVAFGAPRNPTQSITGWSDVEAMLPNVAAPNEPVNVLSVAPADGLIPGGTAPAQASGAAWLVRAADFGFRTSTPIPATTITVGTAHQFGPGASFSVYPLTALNPAWKAVTATHAVTIVNSANDDCTARFSATPVIGSVPASLWGEPPQDSQGNPQVPSPTAQLVANQMVGVAVVVNPPELGGTPGPITAATALAADDIALSPALLPLGSPAPSGDQPVNSDTTVAVIADPGTGIAAAPVVASRGAIFQALTSCGYAPAANDDMTRFSQQIGCALAANPLLVGGAEL